MTYTPADVPGFAGLDLADVEDARGAIEATNCYVHPDGRLIPRPGYSTSGSGGTVTDPATGSLAFQGYLYPPAATVYPSPLLYPSGLAGGSVSTLLVTGHKGDVQLWDSTGVRIALYSANAGLDWSFAALEGSAWGANGNNTLLQATITGITKPTCSTRAPTAQVGVFTGSRDMPKPTFVGVQTPDNRLVAAGFTTTTAGPNKAASSAATVFFSQPDDPTKWDETEYEVVGDAGEPIIGLDNWGDYLIVFKNRNWYVFYGNSVRTDGTGLALFNYRRIEAGCTVKSSVAGSKALYILDTDGNIRATTGGAPQIVFNGDPSEYEPVGGQGFRAGEFIFLPAKRGGSSGYSYPSSSLLPSVDLYPSSANGYLVYDEQTGMVFFWTIGLTAGAPFGNNALFANGTGVATFPSGTTDSGTTILAAYSSPYSSWGSPGVEKSVRQTFFHGEGNLNVQWAKDLQSHGFPRSVTMLRGKGIDRNSVRGETLSYRITGSDFKLNRLVPMLREQRAVGVRS